MKTPARKYYKGDLQAKVMSDSLVHGKEDRKH